jgi:putative heme-binding domain-containing protein
MTKTFFHALTVIATLACCISSGQDAPQSATKPDATAEVVRPRIFLDKSPRVVAYQLNRLSNEQLMLVEQTTEDMKYAPVFTAILTRDGMSPQNREMALAGLVAIHNSDSVSQLLASFEALDRDAKKASRVGGQLSKLLLAQGEDALTAQTEKLITAASAKQQTLRIAAIAGLLSAGNDVAVSTISQSGAGPTQDYLASILLISNVSLRHRQRPTIVELLDDENVDTKTSALRALAATIQPGDKTFELSASFFANALIRDEAVRTMLKVSKDDRDVGDSANLLAQIVEYAEGTPVAERTTDAFIDAMQLADQLVSSVAPLQAKQYRQRLRAVSVRVVRLRTVEEEMRYDTPYFAVEAGRSVQVVLQNEDLMPHNLVFTTPGDLQEVAELGATLPQGEGPEAKQFVPNSPKVLFATDMVPAGQHERLTFTAPTEPGEYPYVCSFPRHWMRMYGVMVVVEDLDAWLKEPIVPKDPIGSNRSFVKSWTIDDFPTDLGGDLRGRSFEIGERLFVEATCAQCHKLNGMGGSVGPELTDVLKRWKGDHRGILREVLDPAHKIDPQYAVQVVYTVDGLVITGIVKSEDEDSISILENPEAKEPRIIPKDEVDEQVRSTNSMMPKALLDRFSRDEILEILSYIEVAHEHKHHHH